MSVYAPSGKQVASCLSVPRAKEIVNDLNKAGIAKEKIIQDHKKKTK